MPMFFWGTRIVLILLMWMRVALLVALFVLSFVFSREIPVAPQLWGNCTTAVRQLHHNCGAVAPQLWGNGNNAGKTKMWVAGTSTQALQTGDA